jgi:hypothetical protein
MSSTPPPPPSSYSGICIRLHDDGGGDIYPALGGDYPGNFALESTQALAANVTGITVPLSGHWIPEEQPEFVIEQLVKFFGSNSTNTNQ